MGKNVGYVRVSTSGQNVERQLAGVELDKIFTDRCSGASAERPELEEMLGWIREDDIVHVHSMDRLARNVCDLRELVAKMMLSSLIVSAALRTGVDVGLLVHYGP